MLKIKSTSKFKKDFKKLLKEHKDISLLYEVIKTLQLQQPLPPKNRDHALKGKFLGYRECHIQSDWLLIYRIYKDALILELTRTGSHSDLLKI